MNCGPIAQLVEQRPFKPRVAGSSPAGPSTKNPSRNTVTIEPFFGSFCYSDGMKTVLFVPGFQENIDSRNYKATIGTITEKGYEVKFVPINWKRTVISDWVKQLENEYDKHDAKNTILAGFSYGSLTAFMAAIKRNPVELWLFSFSPYFSDDIPKMKKSWLQGIGKRRTEAFRQLNFKQLSRSIQCKTLILYGEKEAKKYPLIGNRAEIAHKTIQTSKLIKVPNAGHDVSDFNYLASIKEAI